MTSRVDSLVRLMQRPRIPLRSCSDPVSSTPRRFDTHGTKNSQPQEGVRQSPHGYDLKDGTTRIIDYFFHITSFSCHSFLLTFPSSSPLFCLASWGSLFILLPSAFSSGLRCSSLTFFPRCFVSLLSLSSLTHCSFQFS